MKVVEGSEEGFRFKDFEIGKNSKEERDRRRLRRVYRVEYEILKGDGETITHGVLSRRQFLVCLAEEGEDELALVVRELVIESIATSPFERHTQISIAPFPCEQSDANDVVLDFPAEWVIKFYKRLS